MNVKPKHYGWSEFYEGLCGVFAHAFSGRAMTRRFLATRGYPARMEQLFRALTAERRNRLRYHSSMRRWLEEPQMRAFFEGETREIPQRFVRTIRSHLGPLWDWLPPGALEHDPDAFAKSLTGSGRSPRSRPSEVAGADASNRRESTGGRSNDAREIGREIQVPAPAAGT
jgi:hypothetical protein